MKKTLFFLPAIIFDLSLILAGILFVGREVGGYCPLGNKGIPAYYFVVC